MKLATTMWRRRRDSNPRAREGKRISSAPRYDHFDTTPSLASAKADTRIIIAFSSEKSRENLLIAFLFLS